MNLGSEKEVFEFIETIQRAAEPQRTQLAQNIGIDGCYYEGIHYLQVKRERRIDSSTLSRLPTDYTPGSAHLRVVDNELTYLTQKAAASTHPRQIYMDVRPAERDTGTDAAHRANVHEAIVNAAIDDSGYLRTAQLANWRRTIFGTWGIGAAMEAAGQYGQKLCAFDFDPTCLVTDPNCQHIDLYRHPYVAYTDTWTLDRIKSVFGVEINADDAAMMKDLEAQKIELSELSQRKLFSRYARYSESKAARIYQLHLRDGYRFDKWHVVIEINRDKKILVTDGDDRNPFGGRHGLPFALLHGYLRADTMWSWGEPRQLKDDQDRRNLDATMNQRIKQNFAHVKWRYDKRSFGRDVQPDEIKRYFNNQVGGGIPYEGSDRARNIAPPEPMPMPQPPAFLMDALALSADQMRKKTHKAPGNFGEAKSHVPDKTTMRVLDNADQVAAMRVDLDLDAHCYMTALLHGTTIKMAQERNPATLAMLRENGLDATDLAVVAQTDWRNPGVIMTVQEASLRNLTQQQKMQNVDSAAQMQMLSPDEYKQAKGEELPLSDGDRSMRDAIQKWVLGIVYGQEWQPRPLGRWTQTFIDEAIRAQTLKAVQLDPSALQRLVDAITLQYQMLGQEQVASDPELQAKLASGGGTQSQQTPTDGTAEPQAVSVADVLAQLSQGGGSASGPQPASAA
jgi:hypothetical protein